MSSNILKEADRAMTICNACRYCEGFCAVFPAMELRRTFAERDLKYLSNLCHNCRGCYYACQYAPPHEFALNLPRTLARLRQETYREACWPAPLAGVFRHNGPAVAAAILIALLVVVGLTLGLQDRAILFGAHSGEGAFYRVIPYAAMVLPFLALALGVLAAFWKGFSRLWRRTGGTSAQLLDWRAHRRALWDVLRLKYLDGGGHGCNYPDDRFSMIRRYFHHAVFYGFMLCLAATTIAFGYDHLLQRAAPYPFWSWPVVLGTTGGLALLAGTGGLLYLKRRMDPEPAAPETVAMDTAFTLLLFLTSLSGLLLLALRATPLMGLLLALHLGFVAALFLTMPYGKFVHGLYRYGALLQNAIEQRADRR